MRAKDGKLAAIDVTTPAACWAYWYTMKTASSITACPGVRDCQT